MGFDVASTLLANDYKEPQCVVFEPKSMLAENWAAQEIKNALRAGESKSAHVCVCLNDQGGSVMSVSEDVTATLRAQEHGHQPIVCAFMGGQGAKARSIAYCDDGTTPTLKSVLSGGNTVPDVCYALQANGIDRADTAGCNGSGWREGECYTLNTVDRHAVVYPGVGITSKQNQSNPQPGDPCATLSTDSRNYLVAKCYPDVTGPLMANSHPGSYTGQDAFNGMLPVVPSDKPPRRYIVRRLTPLECCRLQGFPDWWEDGVEGSDSARYKLWGNGMALPNMLFVMRRIAEHDKKG